MITSFLYDQIRAKIILPLADIDKIVPQKGTIYDLGCGQGVISEYLSSTKTRHVVGVDRNVKRLRRAEKDNLKFEKGDLTNYKISPADCIVLSDVLHHLPLDVQNDLLSRISKSLKPGKMLLIKEIDTGEFLRSNLSRLWDKILYPKEEIFFSNSNEMKKSLQRLGFRVEIRRAARLFPGSTNLFICIKK